MPRFGTSTKLSLKSAPAIGQRNRRCPTIEALAFRKAGLICEELAERTVRDTATASFWKPPKTDKVQ